MYPVSEAFLRAVQENTRNYCWTGQITTKGGAVYPFVYEDPVQKTVALCVIFQHGFLCADTHALVVRAVIFGKPAI